MRLRKRGHRMIRWTLWAPSVAPQWVRDRYDAHGRYREQYMRDRTAGLTALVHWMHDSEAAVNYIVGGE